MQYNSQKDSLKISEYGRHVQNLIYYTKSIDDKEKRQKFAESIVSLMHQMNPIHRNNAEYKEKLWRHLFRIADFDIDVTTPSGQIPTLESSSLGPAAIPYPKNIRKYRHYGMNVRTLIARAREMEDEEKKAEFVKIIASYMKLAYRTWNKEHYVNDEIIKQDLSAMSDGQLIVPEGHEIDISAVIGKKRRQHNKGGGRQRNQKNRRRR